jgi:hypothetical protein
MVKDIFTSIYKKVTGYKNPICKARDTIDKATRTFRADTRYVGIRT